MVQWKMAVFERKLLLEGTFFYLGGRVGVFLPGTLGKIVQEHVSLIGVNQPPPRDSFEQ